MSDAEVRRLAPPDRRAPVDITYGHCPQGASCGCCPAAVTKRHRNCNLPHPPNNRACIQPTPEQIFPCPERKTMPQEPPYGLRGHMACCVECGRITARRWTDPESRVLPWCAGQLP